ncbi:alpha/beta hydrolase [Actinospica durhamensis]|uniref:Alpha/beta hydrolase n=1 Tax=Actinospica durhamensis TaxID=1508375 RepID=A0A941EYG4_9ACTN|nr:alpha/beta hydrolase [Actinospica durhamensis]MBR7839596.1 alpha/beta hydrolase [Actinospica durhamensis]
MLIEEHVAVCQDPRIELFTARSSGPADQALLVIHGGPDWDHTYLREPLIALAETRMLVFPDLRGCGRSTTGLPAETYHPDAATADLLNLLDALQIQCADVLGFSYGGLLAQRLALAAPQRIRRLIIASSSIEPVPEAAYDDWPEARNLRALANATWTELLADPTPERTKSHAVAGIPANVWRPEARPELRRRLGDVHFSAEWAKPFIAGTVPSARPDNSLARLAALDIPILLLHGRQDLTFPAALAQSTAAQMPNARAVVIGQAGHMAHIDQPEEWLRAVTDFLD